MNGKKDAANGMTENGGAAKSDLTRERLLKTAEALFIERGYDGVSIKDITDKARATKGHVYYYFKNKQALFDEIIDRYFDAHSDAIFKAASPDASLSSRIHSTVDVYMDFIEQRPGFPRLIQREMCSRSKNTKKISRRMEPVYQWGTAAFAGILPSEGPLAARHFFLNIFAMIINYYTYSPLLEQIWGYDPLSKEALAERRAHLHLALDGIIRGFMGEEKK